LIKDKNTKKQAKKSRPIRRHIIKKVSTRKNKTVTALENTEAQKTKSAKFSNN